MENRSDRKTIVPWFSLTEWNETYKNIYSSDVEEQFTGYEKLLVWKARCPKVPVGVECTIALLQVHIKDQQLMTQISGGVIHPYQEYDLRLMYSTSVMRFLNHISTLGQIYADTLYQIARKMHIPDWLVNLRHDIAHGTCLPNLVLLREAAYFALDWLHEYYWKGEATASENYFIEESDVVGEVEQDEIKGLFEVWQALKLYALANYSSLNEIPDIPLRTYVRNIKHKKTLSRSVFEAQDEENCNKVLEPENVTLYSALLIVKGEINTYLKRCRGLDIGNLLVNVILKGNVFIPDQGVWKIIFKDTCENCLPEWLKRLWVNLLNTLQETHTILPLLLDKLTLIATDHCETDHSRLVASLWIKELCLAIFKTNHMLSVMDSVALNSKKKVLSFKDQWNNANSVVNRTYPNLRGAISLKLTEPLCNIYTLKKIRHIFLSPSKWVNIFLPHILALASPTLKLEMKTKLINLMRMYTQELSTSHNGDQDEPVHTIAELTQVQNETDNVIGNGCDEVTIESPKNSVVDKSDQWVLSEDHHEWERCPLGILPWQRERNLLELNFPNNVAWQPQSPAVNIVPSYDLQHNFPRQIAWNDVLRKRIKKGKIAKKKKKALTNAINNAVKIVMNK